MTSPLTVDLPHTLGREEARRRIASRIGDLPRHIPGGMANVESSWPAENELALEIAALGQRASAVVEIGETVVRVRMILPGMLAFMSGAIESAVKANGAKLLRGTGPRTPEGGAGKAA